VNEQELASRIAQRLEQSLDDLPPRTRYRLELARTAALARAQDAAVPLESLGGGTVAAALGRRLAAPALALVLLAAGVVYWQQAQHRGHPSGNDADVDSALLTDELPVTAYLDQGFEIWLYHDTPAAPSRQP
jgi:hypothetical protein